MRTGTRRGSALVIEDDAGIAQLIRFILEGEGYEVHWAAHGEAALRCIARLAPPALVTLDLVLPHAGGGEVMQRLRATPGWEGVPVVVVSSRPKGPPAAGGACRPDEYLLKPFRPEELRAVARRLAGAAR